VLEMMRLTLAMLQGCLAKAGDDISMEIISGDACVLSIKELHAFQMKVGELHLQCQNLARRMKYGDSV